MQQEPSLGSSMLVLREMIILLSDDASLHDSSIVRDALAKTLPLTIR